MLKKYINFIKELTFTLKDIIVALSGYIILKPIIKIIPKNKNRIAVIGRYKGDFADNAKYFFLQASKINNLDVYFFTENKQIYLNLKELGYKACIYPSIDSIKKLSTSSLVVVDNGQWTKKFREFLTTGAKIIQLWHGVGFKRIGANRILNESNNRPWLTIPIIKKIRILVRKLPGRNITYDLVISTSIFYEKEVFRKSLSSKHYLITGYPRNTFGQDILDSQALWIDVDKEMYNKCILWKKQEKKIIFILPTFRDSKKNAEIFNKSHLENLNEICIKKNIEMIFKPHPNDKNLNKLTGSNLHLISASSDIYPLLPLANGIITDYSSIYSDYTLLNKPIIFFTPDLNDYISNERQIQFDYDSMTPGPKVDSWDKLINILNNLEENDAWSEVRQKFSSLAFDNINQNISTLQIIEFSKSKNWL